MLISLFILSSCSKTTYFCVLKSIKSNRQSDFISTYKTCKEKDNLIDYNDFQNLITSDQFDRINFTLFGFDRNFPLVIDLSKTNIKYFSINGGLKNQFICFHNANEDISIQATKVNILFEQTRIRIKSIILSRSIIYSPNGKMNFFADSLITDGFSLKNNFFTNITCYKYILTSHIKPTAKITILQNENKNVFSNANDFGEHSDNTQTDNHKIHKINSTFLNSYHSKIIRPENSKPKIQYEDQPNKIFANGPKFLESNDGFRRHLVGDDFTEYQEYIGNPIHYIKNEDNSSEEILNSSSVKYCLCMKSRLARCKEYLECDSYFIPLENYVTGKEDWFKSEISHSINRIIRLYVTGTEGMTMNIGFNDFLGNNNTIYFNLANHNSQASLSLTGKYMSSSISQRGVFSVVFNNINQVSIDPVMVQILNEVTLRQSPLLIRPSHHLTLHRLITDTRSIVSFEGTLYITYFLVLNNSEPLQLDGTLFLEEGCITYVPQVSLFPNMFINDEYIIFSDEDQDNDLVLYFTEQTDNSANWTFYFSNEISVEAGQTLSSINISLKTNSESVIPLLFVFDISYQDISLYFDDISKLSRTMLFEVVTSEDKNDTSFHFLEIQIDYTDPPKYALFKRISGNIDLVLMTAKTITYFLDNANPESCFENGTNSHSNVSCNGIDLYDLNSLTFYVYNAMTKVNFQESSIDIYFGTEFISFSAILTNSIQIIVEIETPLQLSVNRDLTKIFPLSFFVISNNSVIQFDDSFTYIADNLNSQLEQEMASCISIYHDDLFIDLVSTNITQIPLVYIENQISGVLYDTSTEIQYNVTKETNLSQSSYRSGPTVIVDIVDDNIIIPQHVFLSDEVIFKGRPFTFNISTKSRSTYVFQNEVKFRVPEYFEHFTSLDFKTSSLGKNGIFENNSVTSLSTTKLNIDFYGSKNNNEIAMLPERSYEFNSGLILEKSVSKIYVARIFGLFFTKSGKISQGDDKIKLLVDSIKSRTISSIDKANFEGPIHVFSDFQLNDDTITEIWLGNETVEVKDASQKMAYFYQALPKATFEVIYEKQAAVASLKFLNSNEVTTNNHIIYLRVIDKKTEILKNFNLTVKSPVTLFFDSSWYNVTNPEDLVINAEKNVKIQTDLIKMPNFTVNLYNLAVETVVIKKPKHTSTIAFYTFLALAIAVFVICVAFCVIDFCCIIKPRSVEIDLNSSSSDRSSDGFSFSSFSTVYEYYSDDEDSENENENENGNGMSNVGNDGNPNDIADNESKTDVLRKISITSYGNTTPEWWAEHIKKRRRRTYNSGEDIYNDEEEEFLQNINNDHIDGEDKKKKKKRKRKSRNKNKKKNANDQDQKNDSDTFEEVYYGENS